MLDTGFPRADAENDFLFAMTRSRIAAQDAAGTNSSNRCPLASWK
jgi:hypothetical protein